MHVPVQTRPFVRLVKRSLLGRGSLDSVAYRTDVLCQQETKRLRPAIFLPGQIERVKERAYRHGDPHSIAADELEAATASSITLPSTIAYHVRNAVLYDGSIYVRNYRHLLGEKDLFASTKGETLHIKEGALSSSYLGSKYFGHWLMDDCPTYLLAESFAPPICTPRAMYGHEQKYQKFFEQDWTSINRANINHLVVFKDFYHNGSKQARSRLLRERFRSNFAEPGPDSYVYLKRGNTGMSRKIENEQELISALCARGFVVVDVGSADVDDIAGKLVSAKVIVSIEGSHINHCTFACPENSAILVLQPDNRFSALQRFWAESLDTRFGFVVGDSRECGYHFPVADVLRTTDLLLDEITNMVCI